MDSSTALESTTVTTSTSADVPAQSATTETDNTATAEVDNTATAAVDNSTTADASSSNAADSATDTSVESAPQTAETSAEVAMDQAAHVSPSHVSEAPQSTETPSDSSALSQATVSQEVHTALNKTSTELNQLQAQLQTQAQEIEQLKGQLQEALQLNRQVSDQIGAAPTLQSLSYPLVLSEVIHLYNSASYEVQIAGNVEKATRILQLAHNTALNAKDPIFNNLANGISADINVLNSSKGVNIDLLFQATTQLQGLLEQVRFISPDLQPQVSSTQVVPASEANPESSSASQAAAESSWFDRAYDTTAQWAGQAYDALSSDIGGLIKVEKLSNPDLGIIPVDQVQLIRNNLKQDVRIAQDAMLKQEEGVWKTSLQSVLDNVLRYYDPQDERMETLVTLIKQLQDLSVKPELPELKFTKEAIEQTSRELKTPSPVQY